jgi:hypothetical protein
LRRQRDERKMTGVGRSGGREGGPMKDCVTRGSLLAALGVVGAAMMLSSSAAAAPTSPFVAAGGGVFDGPGNEIVPEVLQSSATGPVVVETGSLPAAYGKFRGAYGSNGIDIQVTGGIDREVDGGTIWTDGFTIIGGSASAQLQLSARVQGSVIGHAEVDYALYVSSQPFDLQVIMDTVSATHGFWDLQLPGAVRVLYTAVANGCGQPKPMGDCGHVPFENFQGPFDQTLYTSVPFTFGQPIYVASVFAGGVGVFGGQASFFNSADFGLTAPAGASVSALSGTIYTAAVPEPQAALLFALGLAALLLKRVRVGRA